MLGGKDLAQVSVVPLFQNHHLPIVHEVVQKVVDPINQIKFRGNEL